MKTSAKLLIWGLVFLGLGFLLHFFPNLILYLPVKLVVGPMIQGVVKIVFWSLAAMGILTSFVYARRGH